MKTIYITEAQKKKIKKAIAAQDQVGGKVNAAVMDAAAYGGGGMCENVESETKWNGEGEEFNLVKAKHVPSILYHASLRKNRNSILRNGILSGIGEEYSDWWNYDGPNGEMPDDEELPDAVFLSYKPNTWSDTYPIDFMDIYEIDTKKLNKNLFYLDPDRHLATKGCFCYMGDIPTSAFRLINCVRNGKSFSINENAKDNNFKTWYRGYNSKYGSQRNHLLWLTTDIMYAKSYGNRVEEVILNNDKLNPISIYGLDDLCSYDFDYYDGPSKKLTKMALSEGYNCYCFYANQDDSYCMCLWDKSPIVSTRELSEEEFNKIDEWEGLDYHKYGDIYENIEDDEYTLGAEKGMSPYYHVNESNEEIITLYHGVNRKGLEFNLEHGGFIPRVCSEGGPKAVWLSEKQYNYEFTFAFDMPKSVVEQLSNVDYVYGNKIGFDEFNCRLVKSNLYGRIDSRTVVEVNLLDERLSKIQFRYFPDLGMLLWKEYKEFPLILEKYINPYIEKYQTLSESKKKVVKNDEGEIVPETCDKCGGKVVVQIHGEPVYVCKDCGKYFGTVPFTLKENIESEIVNPDDVDLSSFNIKKKLNPKFWKDGILDSRIRLKLLDIADDFISFLGVDWAKPEDITMTGSLANFNWDENYSDIDLHIIMDYSDVDERKDFVSNYFYSQKKLWNEEHSDIKIMGFPVEVFVQDVNERHDSSGVYSLEKNRWVIEPEREKLASSKVNKNFIKDKVSDYMNKIDKLEYLFNKAKDDEYKVRRVMEKSEDLFNKIKDERKLGFEKSGGREINNFNICFKALRRNGYIEKLVNIKSTAYDKLKSLQ